MLRPVTGDPTSESGSTGLPIRQLRDPKALRAIAHPVRIRLLEELAFGGPATATELAERVGESPANCSWHLRQLARYGFVEEAGGGSGRQRPWRVLVQAIEAGEGEQDPELALAVDAASEVLYAREYEAMRAWRARSRARTEDPEWQDPPFTAQAIGWLTPAELDQVGKELVPILTRYTHRVGDPARRPPGSRPIRFVAWGIPAQAAPAPVEGQAAPASVEGQAAPEPVRGQAAPAPVPPDEEIR